MLTNIPLSDQRLIMMRFGNLCAFQRQLAKNTAYGQYFSQDEIAVTNFMLDSVRKHLPMPTRQLALVEPILHKMPYSWQAAYFDGYMEGYDDHICARKVMIKEAIDKAIEDGTERVIFMKPGFCSRAYLSSTTHRDVEHIEIDETPITTFKTRFYESHDIQSFIIEKEGRAIVNQKLHLITADISQQSVKEILNKYKFDLTKKTLVVIEALTPYKSEQALRQLLDRDNLGLSDESEVLVGFMAQPSESQQSFGGGEDESFFIPYKRIPNFLNQGGWSISSTFSAISERTLLPPALQKHCLTIDSSPEVYVSMQPRAMLYDQDIAMLDEMDLPSFKPDSVLATQLREFHQPRSLWGYPSFLNFWPAQQAIEAPEPAAVAESDETLASQPPDYHQPH